MLDQVNNLLDKMLSGRAYLVIFLVLSLSLNLFQIMKYEYGWNLPQLKAKEQLSPNRLPNTLLAIGRNGEKVKIVFGNGREVVLHGVSPTCIWCQRNARSFENLYQSLKAKDIDVYIVASSLVSIDSLIPQGFPDERILNDPDREIQRQAGMQITTPSLLWINSNGVRAGYFTGAFIGTVKSDVERAFGIVLSSIVP